MHLTNYILKRLRRKKLKYISCIFGFSVAISSTFVLISLSINLDESMQQFYLTDQNAGLIIEKGTSLFQIIPYNSIVDESLVEKSLEIQGVTFSLPLIFKEYENSSELKVLRDIVVGIPMNLLEFFRQDMELSAGRFPIDLTSEILISPDVGGGNLKVNDTIKIRNNNFKITGIFKPYNLIFDSFIYIDIETAQGLYGLTDQCSAIFITVNSNADFDQIDQSLQELDSDVSMLSSNVIREFSGSFLMLLQVVQIVLSFFPLIISSFYVFIILLFNIRERRKEFGILKAIGMSNLKLMELLLLETLIITILSYLLGVIVGFFLYGYAYGLMNQITFEMSFIDFVSLMITRIPFEAYFYVFLISLTTGLIVSVYPIIISMRTNIVELYRRD